MQGPLQTIFKKDLYKNPDMGSFGHKFGSKILSLIWASKKKREVQLFPL